MTETQVRKRIQEKAEGFPSIAAAARFWGITKAYLHDVLRGRRGISDTLAACVGYRKVETKQVRFERIK